ncbi:MAG: general secretion pathway protein GspK [Xanthomonadales bacterium]|nr:general secretion pathway protein GspK [Gammaproteobacteria bacterium]MBT8052623.1 general secretion pathway protein GspK [Gammaproteobacteria bacterium]NND56618.1 general secretion pathway protein GspK [Xanthomonadales bacterium]NNK52440.1 general secretion pathway protein GspK [Xanthomonadales bacterium]
MKASRLAAFSLSPPGHQRGIALVIVLWILLLVTISTGAYTLMARMDQLEAHTVISSTRARMAAESGINLAVLSLRDPDELNRLIPDGRPYAFQVQDIFVEIEVTDERGKVDINSVNEQTLLQLLQGHGLQAGDAEYLAAAILDWVDVDEIERASGAELPAYESAGLGVGPANRPFVMIEELLQVLGMPWDLFKKMEPGLTVFSKLGVPDAAYAPLEALLAIPDMTEEDALNFIAERQSEDASGGMGATLPNGQVAVARGRGLTYSVLAKATLPNGIWDQVEATIRLGGGGDGRPYTVLKWQEGFHN